MYPISVQQYNDLRIVSIIIYVNISNTMKKDMIGQSWMFQIIHYIFLY